MRFKAGPAQDGKRVVAVSFDAAMTARWVFLSFGGFGLAAGLLLFHGGVLKVEDKNPPPIADVVDLPPINSRTSIDESKFKVDSHEKVGSIASLLYHIYYADRDRGPNRKFAFGNLDADMRRDGGSIQVELDNKELIYYDNQFGRQEDHDTVEKNLFYINSNTFVIRTKNGDFIVQGTFNDKSDKVTTSFNVQKVKEGLAGIVFSVNNSTKIMKAFDIDDQIVAAPEKEKRPEIGFANRVTGDGVLDFAIGKKLFKVTNVVGFTINGEGQEAVLYVSYLADNKASMFVGKVGKDGQLIHLSREEVKALPEKVQKSLAVDQAMTIQERDRYLGLAKMIKKTLLESIRLKGNLEVSALSFLYNQIQYAEGEEGSPIKEMGKALKEARNSVAKYIDQDTVRRSLEKSLNSINLDEPSMTVGNSRIQFVPLGRTSQVSWETPRVTWKAGLPVVLSTVITRGLVIVGKGLELKITNLEDEIGYLGNEELFLGKFQKERNDLKKAFEKAKEDLQKKGLQDQDRIKNEFKRTLESIRDSAMTIDTALREVLMIERDRLISETSGLTFTGQEKEKLEAIIAELRKYINNSKNVLLTDGLSQLIVQLKNDENAQPATRLMAAQILDVASNAAGVYGNDGGILKGWAQQLNMFGTNAVLTVAKDESTAAGSFVVEKIMRTYIKQEELKRDADFKESVVTALAFFGIIVDRETLQYQIEKDVKGLTSDQQKKISGWVNSVVSLASQALADLQEARRGGKGDEAMMGDGDATLTRRNFIGKIAGAAGTLVTSRILADDPEDNENPIVYSEGQSSAVKSFTFSQVMLFPVMAGEDPNTVLNSGVFQGLLTSSTFKALKNYIAKHRDIRDTNPRKWVWHILAKKYYKKGLHKEEIDELRKTYINADISWENTEFENGLKDKALISNEEHLGGIDFNAANLNLQIKRDGKGVPLPISQQNLENIKLDGLIPVILDIKSAMDVPLLAELRNAAKQPEQLAKV
ncbi:MAG: hypothetical protein HQL15_02000 [Candidatus Omnitrophica bacterium]|nr:hypothetical protein [Candidatus Omnitrophota bacterium]